MKILSIFSILLVFVSAIVALTSTSSSAFRVGPPAPATLEASTSFFNKLAAGVVPVINEYAKTIVIPGQDQEHFQFDSFKLASFNLGPIKFSFVAPDSVEVEITSFEMSVNPTEFELKDKILFIDVHCHGDFSVSTSGDSAKFTMKLINKDGKLQIDGSSEVSVHYGKLSVEIDMRHFVCRIAEGIVNLFTGGVDNLVRKMIEKDLAPMMQKTITAALDKAFEKMPMKLTGAPNVKNSNPPVLVLPIDLDSFVKPQQQQQQQQQEEKSILQQPPALLSSTLNRLELLKALGDASVSDIAVVLPEASVNTVLETVKTVGKLGPIIHVDEKLTTKIFEALLPNAYKVCPNCKLRWDVDFTKAPNMIFRTQNATLNVQNLSLGIAGVNGSHDEDVHHLFTLGLLADLSLENFTIAGRVDNIVHFDFGLEALTFSQVKSDVGPLPIGVLNLISSLIQSTLIPAFNKEWKGIDFFQNSTFDINRIDIDVQHEVFRAGLDVTLKQ